jgi:hypothetical protein
LLLDRLSWAKVDYGPFPDQAIAGAVQGLKVEFLDRLQGKKSHVASNSSFGDGLSVVEVVLI